MLDKLKRIMEYLRLDDEDDGEVVDIETRRKHDKRQWFLNGLCAGAFLSFILLVSSEKIADLWMAKKADNNNINYYQVSEKLKLLEQYVDQVYLNPRDAEKMENGIYNGFIDGLGDKYSSYYTQEEYKDLMESTDGEYCGIGVYVHQDKETKTITFEEPFKDGPAAKAGMKKGDVLVAINQEPVEGKALTDIVKMLKGKKGTNVQIDVKRGNETLSLAVTLEEVTVQTVHHKMLQDDIGYLQVTKFDKVTVAQFKEAIDKLQKQGMKGIIIDLRGNPGGLLTSVTEMLDRIIKEGTLVSTKDKNGKGETFKATDKESLDLPMAVLINGGSASASELFAGAIQDYGIGTLVGTKSYGKGVVQNIYGLKDGSAVKLTVSKYYTPKGRNIQGTGIEPDVKVELDEALKDKKEITVEEDNQIQSAVRVVKNKMK